MSALFARLRERLNALRRRHGTARLLLVPLFPLTALVVTPIRLIQTLWSFRVVATGRWEAYHGTTAFYGLVNFFYYTMALNLWRYGRMGISPSLGLGHFRLTGFFFQCQAALFAYWRLAPVVPLMGMAAYWCSHAIWATRVEHSWLVMLLMLAGTCFYIQTFIMQAYPPLGWMFVPAGLFAMVHGYWLLAAVCWLGVSFASLTVMAVVTWLACAWSLTLGSWMPLLCVAPGLLKISSHLWWNLKAGDLCEKVLSILKSIGTVRREARYVSPKAPLTVIYHALWYGQFAACLVMTDHPWAPLAVAAWLLALTNGTVLRFADPSSMSMMMLSLAAGAMLATPVSAVWLSAWLILCPLPLIECEILRDRVLDVVPKLSPFPVGEILDGLRDFLHPVPNGKRVFMGFSDPGCNREQAFDGQKALMEPPMYLAAEREIHWLPSEWAVIALNTPDSPNLWGRTPEELLALVQQWQADFAVVWQEPGTSLDPGWADHGWQQVGHFSWGAFPRVREEQPYTSIPEWFLLRPPTSGIQSGP